MARAQTHEPETPMSREEFLAWVDQQPSGRFERIDGIVVAMAPERASHNLRKGAARDALRPAIRGAGLTACQVFGGGMTVQVEDGDFEPDALMHCGPPLQGDAIRVNDPLVLVEALSPDTAVLNATGSHLVASRHPDPWLNESDLQQVADFVISSHRE
jgi:Uma2 family endonuclease